MSNTTHPFAPEEIMAFVDGELSADRAQSISAHIDQCTECQEVAASFRSTSHSLAKWTIRDMPISAELEQHSKTATAKAGNFGGTVNSEIFRRTRQWTWKQWGVGLAGTAALAMLLFSITVPNLLRSKMAAKEASAIARRRAQQTAITLDDEGDLTSPEDGYTRKEKALPQVRASKGFDHLEPQAAFQVGPMIARTVALSIVVKDFDAARGSLDAILARHNGYAADLNVATPQGNARTIQASLRTPAAHLVAAVAELKALGRVENETQNGEEVTQQHADLVARLKNSRETEQRLQDVLRTRTGKVKDVLEVEEEIARVRGEIEQMEAEQQTLEHRVNFATIDLKLAEEYKAQLTSPAPSVVMQLRNAAVNGFRNASESLLGIILFFAESAPTLLLWLLILLLPARMFWRRYKRALLMGSSFGG
jgi:hypothetical protein